MRRLRTRSKIFLTGKNRMQGASGFCSARFRPVVFCAPHGSVFPFCHCGLDPQSPVSLCLVGGRCPHRPASFPLSFGFLVFRLMRVTFLCSKKSPKKASFHRIFPQPRGRSFRRSAPHGADSAGEGLASSRIDCTLRLTARCKDNSVQALRLQAYSSRAVPSCTKSAKHCHSERSEES